jgi:hypothetical protein
MADDESGPAPKGHNSKLTADQEEALFLTHLQKLRVQAGKVDEIKAELDGERAILTDIFRLAKSDGFSRKELQAILDDSKSLRRDLTAEEDRRAKLRAWAGLPSGSQADLFASTPIETRDEMDAEGQGLAMGLRGDSPTLPDSMHARFSPAFMKGWHAGQERLVWGLAEAGKIVDRDPNSGIRPAPVVLEPEPDELEPEVIAAKAKKLKKKGFMERTAEPLPSAGDVLTQARADEATDRAEGNFEQPAAA